MKLKINLILKNILFYISYFIRIHKLYRKTKIYKKKKFFKQQLISIMRFQSIENNKIYRLYRQDQMERLKQKIQQIKQRKNRHVHSNKQTHLLPYISPGYGFSQQRKRQIDKQNVRLQQKIKKAKDSHSTYYITKDDLSRINTINKKSKVRYIQTMTNRSVDQNMIRSLAQSDRNTLKQAEKMNKKVDIDKQEQSIRPNTFRKQIMRIYNEAFSDPKKLPL